jgi:hypothetical protein
VPNFPIGSPDEVKALFLRLLGSDVAQYEQGRQEALSKSNPQSLSDDERLAIWFYSSTDDLWYTRVNRELWTLSPSDDIAFFAELLNAAIAKLQPESGTVFRGYRTADLAAFLAGHRVRQTIRWPGFSSSSRILGQAFPGNVLFVIKSKTGKILGSYADRPAEAEILLQLIRAFECWPSIGGADGLSSNWKRREARSPLQGSQLATICEIWCL